MGEMRSQKAEVACTVRFLLFIILTTRRLGA